MAGGLALSGLASGVDTASIVSQLMALDRQTTTRMTYRQAAVTAQRTGLTTIAAKLSALQSAAKALGDDASWAHKQTVESSDAKVGVTLVGGAGIGGHTVQVDRLASSMQRGYTFSAATGGTIHLESAADPGVAADVTVAPGATLQGISVWSTQTLIRARLEQDPAAIETVAELFGELRESWAQVAAA